MKKSFVILTCLVALFFTFTDLAAKKKENKISTVPQMLNYPSAKIDDYRLHGGNVVLRCNLMDDIIQILPLDEIRDTLNMMSDALKKRDADKIIDRMKKEHPEYIDLIDYIKENDNLDPKNFIKDFIKEKYADSLQIVMKAVMNNIGAQTIVDNYMVNETDINAIEFDHDLSIHKTIHIPYPMFVYIHPFTLTYMCPGDTIDLHFNFKEKNKMNAVSTTGTGLSGEVNKYAKQLEMNYCPPFYISPNTDSKDSLLIWKDKQVKELDELIIKLNEGLPEFEEVSPLAKDILKTHLISTKAEPIFYHYSIMDNEVSSDTIFWQKYFDFVSDREDYLLNNPLMMIASKEGFFNSIDLSCFDPLRNFQGYTLFSTDFKSDIYRNTELNLEQYRNSFYDARINGVNYICNKLNLKRNNDFMTQATIARDLFFMIKHNQPEMAPEYFASIMPFFTNKHVARQALLSYNQFIKENMVADNTDNKPMTKGDSIFQRIIEPYKGNVLYIDFWEIGCGPCRGGMLAMRDEVKNNADKPVKYLYITDSKEEDCRSFLEPNNIKGEHIFITRNEWSHLQEKFNFNGIPFVVHVDDKGKIQHNTSVDILLQNIGK